MNKKIPKVAVFVNGGVNSGFKNQGVPVLMTLLNGLGSEIQLTVYSLSIMNHNQGSFRVRMCNGPVYLKVLKIFYYFTIDHLSTKFNLVQGFWGLSSGRLAVFLGRLFQLPSILTLMGGETASLPEISYGITQAQKKVIFNMLRKCSKVINLSEFQKEQLKMHGFKDFDKFIQIPFGVKQQVMPVKCMLRDEVNLIHVGNINKVKDHHTLLMAFQEVRKIIPAKLKIVGGDFMQEAIHRLAEGLDLEQHIQFTGQVTLAEGLALMDKSDLMVISSLSEGQSVVFVEAMSLGLPTCSTAVGLMKELSDITCLTSPVRDAHALAQNILKLLKDEELYQKLSKNGFQWAAENDEEATKNKYLETYYRMVE